MTPARFAEIGIALHGAFWKRSRASDLDNSIRTVERWADGSDPIPAGVAGDLAALCDEHVSNLSKIATELRGDQ